MAAVASLTGGLAIAAYLQLRPNTAGLRMSGPFDGERAFADLTCIASFGPRPSGSPPLERTRQFIIGELNAAGVTVAEDKFTASTPVGSIPMVNLIAKIPGRSPSIVILAGHYDTKRMTIPFVGANDGASGSAFLLEMARVLTRKNNELTYWLVFFDGEEAVKRWSAKDSLYGSRHLARSLAALWRQNRIKAVIVVDMIADSHLDIHRESHSTSWLADIVVAQAGGLGYRSYFPDSLKSVEDDHLPFVELGIPAIDIIDLDYGPFNLYWHTRFDTVDKCSPNSLAAVGATFLKSLEVLERTLGTRSPGS